MSQKKDLLHGQELKMSMKQKFLEYEVKISTKVVYHLKDFWLQGAENKISLVQTYSKTFHCTYLLHDYPFDTQVCSTDEIIIRVIIHSHLVSMKHNLPSKI